MEEESGCVEEIEAVKGVPRLNQGEGLFTNYSAQDKAYWLGDNFYGAWTTDNSQACSDAGIIVTYIEKRRIKDGPTLEMCNVAQGVYKVVNEGN